MPKASDFPGHNRPWYVCWEKIYFTRFQPGAYDFHDGFWKYFKSRDHAHGDSSSPRSCWRFPNAWCSNLGASNQLFYNRIFQPVPASNITAREHFEKETCPKHDILTMRGSQLAWITKKSSLFDMRMHIRIWGLDGWQQWSSPSDFENLDFSLRVCHVAHSSGWIDLPVCGLKIYHLEINWSGTFRKQMCYLTIGSANLFFEHGHVYIYISCISKSFISAHVVPPLLFLPRIATRTLLLCALCIVRSVHWEIEQPASSTFIHFPYLKWMIRVLQNFVAINIHRLWGSQKECVSAV